jgi:predicted permease
MTDVTTTLRATVADLSYAMRVLGRSRGFAVGAISIVALCTGLNIGIFSIVNALILRPPAVASPEELAFIYSDSEAVPTLGAYSDVRRLGDTPEIFAGAAAMNSDIVKLRTGGSVDHVFEEAVTSDYFDVLGVRPLYGRLFIPSDETPDAASVAVISDALWRRHFNADPDVLGRQLSLVPISGNTVPPSTIVGVVGPEFGGMASRMAPTEVWVPLATWAHRSAGILGSWRDPAIGMLIARMRPGVPRERAQALVDVWASDSGRRLLLDPTRWRPAVHDSRRVFLPFDLSRRIAPGRLGVVLLAGVGLVLVIGIANLAGVLLARGIVRRGELATRMILGASRGRIARLILSETLLIAAAGGIVGVMLSRWIAVQVIDGMPAAISGAAGFVRQVTLGVPFDSQVAWYTVLLVLATGLAIGIAPQRQLSTIDAIAVSSRGSGASRRVLTAFRRWILVPQLALSMALLVLGAVSVRALLTITLVPSGYEAEGVTVARVDLPEPLGLRERSEDTKRVVSDYRELFKRFLAVAETSDAIEAAALTDALPVSPGTRSVVGLDEFRAGRPPQRAAVATVTPRYFDVLGLPFMQGRTFAGSEIAGGARVVIVDAAVAAQQWPGESAIGRQLALPAPGAAPTSTAVSATDPLTWLEVIGVVGSVRSPLSEGEVQPFVYLPWSEQTPHRLTSTLVARGRTGSPRTIEDLRRIALQADPRAGVVEAVSLAGMVEDIRYSRRMVARLTVLCALMGLTLACAGLFSVVSYAVAQRRHELSIRSALGATGRSLAGLVVKESGRSTAIGVAIGLLVAFVAIGVTSAYVLPVPKADWLTIAGATSILALTSGLACLVPASRAARSNPAALLKSQQ